MNKCILCDDELSYWQTCNKHQYLGAERGIISFSINYNFQKILIFNFYYNDKCFLFNYNFDLQECKIMINRIWEYPCILKETLDVMEVKNLLLNVNELHQKINKSLLIQ